MNAHKLRGAMGSLAVLALMGCATMKVQSDYNELASFSHLRTYAWADAGKAEGSYTVDTEGAGTNGSSNGSSRARANSKSRSDRTYTGGSYGSPVVNSPLLDRRIRDAFDAELARRGFVKAPAEEADFLIDYYLVADERVSVHTFDRLTYGHGYGGLHRFRHPFFFGHHLGPYYTTSSYTREYLEGTLILDVVDAKTNEVIWRGWASKSLDRNPKPDKVRKYVAQAVEHILEEFPPRFLYADDLE